jgi:uncharacterized membrane protein YedE/YeeE
MSERACSSRVSLLLAGISGALFGAGLLISAMTDPARVIGFLDVTAWDPTLLFVMGGAVITYGLAFRLIPSRRADPWFGETFHIPTRRDVDRPLLIGSALFGIGWGLGGFCPGPALVSAASGSTSALVFVASMVAGMLYFQRTVGRVLDRR